MSHIYLTPWQWATPSQENPRWQAPGGGGTVVDLRMYSQKAAAGGTPGLGVFAYAAQQNIAGSVYLGQDIEAQLTFQQRNACEALLGYQIPILSTPRSLLVGALTVRADETDQSATKPLIGRLGRTIRLILRGELIFEDDFVGGGHRLRTINVFRADYRRWRLILESLQGAEAEEYFTRIRKWAGWWLLAVSGRLDADVSELLPPEYVSDGVLAPTTSISDPFSSDTIANYTLSVAEWTVTSGIIQQSRSATGSSYALHTTNLSGADHFAEIERNLLDSGGGPWWGTIARGNGTDESYFVQLRGTSGNNSLVQKVVGGTESTIIDLGALTSANGDVLRLAPTGSTIDVLRNSVSLGSTTDTSLTAGRRCGIIAATQGAGTNRFDNFLAEDVTVAEFVRPKIIVSRQAVQRAANF